MAIFDDDTSKPWDEKIYTRDEDLKFYESSLIHISSSLLGNSL